MPTLSDEQVKAILFSPETSQAETAQPTSTGDLAQFYGNSPNGQAGSAVTTDSPLNLTQRLALSFADDVGREKYLRQRYPIVQRLENGKFAVGTSMTDIKPIDPEGLLNDIPGDMADVVGVLPSLLGQIGGSMVGGAAGGIPGAIAGAGLGAGAGELASKFIGKVLGVNDETGDAILRESGISGVAGSAGEGIAQGLTYLGSRVIAPKLAQALDQAIANADEVSPGSAPKAIRVLAKVLHGTSGVPEQSVIDLYQTGGFEKGFDPKLTSPESVVPIVKNLQNAVNETTDKLGQRVAIQTEQLQQIAARSGVQASIDANDIYQLVAKRAQDLGLIDIQGYADPYIVKARAKDAQVLFPLMRKLGASEAAKNVDQGVEHFSMGIIKNKIPLVEAQKIMRAFGGQIDNASPELKMILTEAMSGGRLPNGKVVDGFRTQVNNIAEKLGQKNFIEANTLYSKLLTLKANLADVGLNTKKSIAAENFIRGIEKQGVFARQDLAALQQMAKSINPKHEFLTDMVRWNAAQDFAGSNPNYLRLGAIASLFGFSDLFGFGKGDPRNRAIRIGTGLLFASPAGAKFVLRNASRAGAAASAGLRNSALNYAEMGTAKMAQPSAKAAAAVLSRLIGRSGNR